MKTASLSDKLLYFCCMRQGIIHLLLLLLLIAGIGSRVCAQDQPIVVPYTLSDRDRSIVLDSRMGILDTRIQSLESLIASGLDDQQRQTDDLKTLYYWGFGIMISLFLFMLGYMIWDHRTAMKPALEQAAKALEKNRGFLTVLREYSKRHPDFAEILRSHGIL